MLTWNTFLGMFVITAGATLLGSTPVLFHKYLKASHWNWWESFGGGVMVSASFFSLWIPAYQMLNGKSLFPMFHGMMWGFLFIFFSHKLLEKMTNNHSHRKAFLFVLAMGIHTIPEGLAVGVDVAALGWKKALPLGIAIFIQNLPEGLVSSMSFLISGFSVTKSLLANALTALIEVSSAVGGFSFAKATSIGLPFLLSFAGACMVSVVMIEAYEKYRSHQGETIRKWGFGLGLVVCEILDVFL